jgi:hypothetical protein
MKLVFIYGMPGVGKLTTARALASQTGIRLFHNHLTFNLVDAVFDFPTPPFGRLVETVRLATFEAAAREGLPGLIFTCVYAAPEDDAFIENTIGVVERHGGTVAFVRLYCAPRINDQRVIAEDRRALGKITTVDSLRRMQPRWRLDEAIPFQDSLEIDNSALDPDESARRIATYFALPARVRE